MVPIQLPALAVPDDSLTVLGDDHPDHRVCGGDVCPDIRREPLGKQWTRRGSCTPDDASTTGERHNHTSRTPVNYPMTSEDTREDSGPFDRDGDTFGVGIHVTETAFEFVVHVPSDIDSGWTDPEAFQSRIEDETWTRLDRERTLRAVDATAATGETVTLGTITMRPDGTVVEYDLSRPTLE